MLMPTSSEFLALCRAQVAILIQGLGASCSVVYLTQQLVEGAETRFVPIVAYPESGIDWENLGVLRSPRLLLQPSRPLLGEALLEPASSLLEEAPQPDPSPHVQHSGQSALMLQRQMVVPLMHENVVLGLLVAARDDRGWNVWEQQQIEHVADTLTLACVLDQRHQWLEHDREQERLLQAQQHDLLDNLLHQFRNSLTALQTFGKLIVKRLVPGDANTNIANSIVRETNRLKELAQQLELAAGIDRSALALPPVDRDQLTQDDHPDAHAQDSRIPATGLIAGASLPLESCSVVAILEPLIASAQTIAQDQNLILTTQLADALPSVRANAQALREVLNNLIENALKYTPKAGRVAIAAYPLTGEKAWVEISVSDTGPGIPPEDVPHIFERRYRGIQAETSIPGSGLGLAIAKTLIDQMQGEIQFFSPARSIGTRLLETPASHTKIAEPNKTAGPGTTFLVRLPAEI